MFELGLTAVFIIIGYTVGSAREKRHYESLILREKQFLNLSVRPHKSITQNLVHETKLVTSSVVIASDYFKTIAAALKSFVGGNVNSQETLLDRARREAVLRLKEKAQRMGASEIVGLRLEATSLDKVGVEVMAYGTALILKA